MQHYLNSLNVSQRRKYNIRSLTSQFFNWCIKRNYTTFNPASKIEITVPRSDIAILAPDEAAKFLKTCEDEFPDLTPYVAISLFAGLRPTECALLKWENIHLDEMQITVRHDTSKVSETRNVPIEENLCRWIGNYKVDTKGFVTKQKGLRNRLQRLRMKMGYKLNGVNPDGPSWKEDTFRHSYASYWLGRNKDRAHLAENMGNSINVIKSHYKQIVSTTDTEAFWGIVPAKALTNQYKIETVQRILAKKLERYSKTEQ